MSEGESITAQGLADLRAEVEELEGPARRAMAERIKAARELGDLKENAEYHIAKEDQAHLETRIKRLRQRLVDAEVVEVDEAAETFAFGRTAEVLDEAGGKRPHLDPRRPDRGGPRRGPDLGRVAGRPGDPRRRRRRRGQGVDAQGGADLQGPAPARLRPSREEVGRRGSRAVHPCGATATCSGSATSVARFGPSAAPGFSKNRVRVEVSL